MPIGASDIPDLRLTRLQKLIERFTAPPNLILMKMFSEDKWDSDNIEWEGQIGNRGLAPFVAPGARSPMTAPAGVSKHSAFAAYWAEKMYFDEQFLNNLREPGTREVYHTAQKQLAKNTQMLKNRIERRKEWMFAKMLANGGFTYKRPGGFNTSVDYGIPDENQVTLAADYKWSTGSKANILKDIMDAQLALQNAGGIVLNNAIFTTEVLYLMIQDASIQTLLQKSTFGNGDLFARPKEVLGSLLNIPSMTVYDEQYQIRGWLTSAVTGGSTTDIYVDDASDFESGYTLRFYDVSAGTWEDETISAVDVENNKITVSTAPTASFAAGADFVTMTKKFLPTNKFIMFASEVEGQKIAEYYNAPFGLQRLYGLQVDQHEDWDPDGVYIRVRNKGLPVLYQEDAVYQLTVS